MDDPGSPGTVLKYRTPGHMINQRADLWLAHFHQLHDRYRHSNALQCLKMVFSQSNSSFFFWSRPLVCGENLPVHIVGGLYTWNFGTCEIFFALEFQNEYWTGFDCEPPIELLLINDSLVIIIGEDGNVLPVSFSVKWQVKVEVPFLKKLFEGSSCVARPSAAIRTHRPLIPEPWQ